MGRVTYVNGRYLPHAQAGVHLEDRGLQFADAIYEVVGVAGGQFLDEEEHLERLERSVREIGMAAPMERGPLKLVLREMARRNRVRDGLIYMQVTRGAMRRDHPVPEAQPRPTLIITARSLDPQSIEDRRVKGVRVITEPDERWARCDIKSTSLLPNVLAKTAARKAGAFEAWLVDSEGYVTEGASTSAWIVSDDGRIVTRDLSNSILPGVTRRVILKAASEAQIPVEERKFTVAEALAAKEAFITAATLGATAVVAIDGQQIGDGKPGPLARRIQELYRHAALVNQKAQESGR
ncbi:MAG: D-amino-acid transaminase [Alphaproteobacteria bacterium]|nr:D-amino-acid transaminase [Alphaproteobacteria bacterium]